MGSEAVMVQADQHVLVERRTINEDGHQLGLITLNRPAEMNPLDWGLVLDLGSALRDLDADGEVRAIAITGAGNAFSAGGDMKKYGTLQRDAVDFPLFLECIHEVFGSINQMSKPVIALVNGIAVAGGIELILSCDVAFASSAAKIGDAHLVFGQMGGGGALTLLPRAVGPARARELVLSGRTLDAAEAQDWGIVSAVVEPDALIEAGEEFARTVSMRSPLAVANAKRVMNAAWNEGTGVSSAMRLEREVTARYCLTSNDAPEGLEAFAEKRLPKYTGS